MNFKIVMCDIGKNAALNPACPAELGNARTLTKALRRLLILRQRAELMPHRPICQLAPKTCLVDFFKELVHALFEEGNVCRIECTDLDICRMRTNRAAGIDDAADHADAGALAKNARKTFAVITADDSLAAAHELE